MENQRTEKQWWAPVWKGLVMDAEAKHYRAMKNAIWLYLYLLLNANRKTGLLMRKIATVSNDMGITRDSALRWLKVLRSSGYIETVNTGRSLTIQLTRWKPIVGVGRNQRHISGPSDFSYGKHSTSPTFPVEASTPHNRGHTGVANETKNQRNNINDPRGRTSPALAEQELTRLGSTVRQAMLARELAERLNDLPAINLYKAYAATYPEWLLRKVLAEVEVVPRERITKGQGALFNYLIQLYAKGAPDNPGH